MGKKLRLQVFAFPARTCLFEWSSQNNFQVCHTAMTLSYLEKVKKRFLCWMRTPGGEETSGDSEMRTTLCLTCLKDANSVSQA